MGGFRSRARAMASAAAGRRSVSSALADDRVVALRKLQYKLLGHGVARGFVDLFRRRVAQKTVTDICKPRCR